MPDKSRPSAGASRGKGTRPSPPPTGDAGRRRRGRHESAAQRRPKVRPKNGLDRYFEISARRSTVGREVRGGLTTFFTMAYIVLLNPIILSGADVEPGPMSRHRAAVGDRRGHCADRRA